MTTYENELYHHGILGQKWGVRRFQNEDGSLTDAGAKRYGVKMDKSGTRKTAIGRAISADRAAMDRGKWAVSDASKKETTLRGKLHQRLGYTGGAVRAEAMSKSYAESSKRNEQAGKMKDAIRMQAVANNQRSMADYSRSVANSKGFDRIYKANYGSGDVKKYSSAGREYTVQSESIKNALTLGYYSLAADAKYKRQYTAEERLARMREG